MALHNVIRGDHLDWFEAKFAAGSEAAANPLGLGALWNIRQRILDRDTHRLTFLKVCLFIVTGSRKPHGSSVSPRL
jgi:hypothetical protein